MKRKLISFNCAFFLLFGMLTGCTEVTATSLVNTLTFDTGDFASLRLDYDADDIIVLESADHNVMVKEYMNVNKKSYYAKTFMQNGELLITEGNRPRRSNFKSYIEVYIPKNYTDDLSLHSTSGTVTSKIPLNLSGIFRIDTTSGMVEVSNTKASTVKAVSTNGMITIENMNAKEVNIQTTNAKTSMKQITGTISYQSKGGTLTATDLYGSGSFHASGNGSIDITFADVSSDILAYAKNGTLKVTLPGQLNFKFSAVTKNGSIDTSFPDQLVITDDTAAGDVGASADITVELETRNGDIKVFR